VKAVVCRLLFQTAGEKKDRQACLFSCS